MEEKQRGDAIFVGGNSPFPIVKGEREGSVNAAIEKRRDPETISVGGNSQFPILKGENAMLARVIPIHSKMPSKLPPELAERKDDLSDMYLSGTRYVERRLRGKPSYVVTELVNSTFIKLATTHRCDPDKLPLEEWFHLLLQNAIKQFYAGSDVVDIETAAQYRNYEVAERHVEVMPPDEVLIEREERAAHALAAWMVPAQIAAVEAAVAHHPIASAVLAEWQAHGADLKPQALAERLGVSERQIYKAKELIKRHAIRIRQEMADREEAS